MLLAAEMAADAYGLRRWKMERHERTEVDIALVAVTGLLTGLISLHLLLDWAYLRGAFLLLPTLYGWLLLCLLLAWGGAPTWRTLDGPACPGHESATSWACFSLHGWSCPAYLHSSVSHRHHPRAPNLAMAQRLAPTTPSNLHRLIPCLKKSWPFRVIWRMM